MQPKPVQRQSTWALLHAGSWDRSSGGQAPPAAVTKGWRSGTARTGRPQRVRAPYAKPHPLPAAAPE